MSNYNSYFVFCKPFVYFFFIINYCFFGLGKKLVNIAIIITGNNNIPAYHGSLPYLFPMFLKKYQKLPKVQATNTKPINILFSKKIIGGRHCNRNRSDLIHSSRLAGGTQHQMRLPSPIISQVRFYFVHQAFD
jgi:hypothetical protein